MEKLDRTGLDRAWNNYLKQQEEGLRLCAEGDNLCEDGNKRIVEGNKLIAEGYSLWVKAFLEFRGNIKAEMVGLRKCTLETGEVFEKIKEDIRCKDDDE
jgi:hypothetical protein